MSSLQENVTTRNASLFSSLSQNGNGFPFFLHLPFVHLLFLDLIFSFSQFFLCLVLSFTSFVTDLICLYFLLACDNYLSVPLSIFVSILSCRFCIIVFEPIFVSNLLFFLLCPFVFSPPFIFFFLSFDFHELRRRRRRRSVSKRNITCADASVTLNKKDHSPSREG